MGLVSLEKVHKGKCRQLYREFIISTIGYNNYPSKVKLVQCVSSSIYSTLN